MFKLQNQIIQLESPAWKCRVLTSLQLILLTNLEALRYRAACLHGLPFYTLSNIIRAFREQEKLLV